MAALAFALGVAAAGAGGAIVGVLYPFLPGSHYLWIARLLAIIVLGGMGSLRGRVLGALLLGVAETLTARTSRRRGRPPSPTRSSSSCCSSARRACSAPGCVRTWRHEHPRSDSQSDRHVDPSGEWRWSPMSPRRALIAVAALALAAYPLVSDDLYYQNMIILSLVFAIGASGLNIISGYGGYVSLGQGAFLGLGGYTVGVLATHVRRLAVALGAGGGPGRGGCSRALLGLSRCARAGPRS